MPRVRNWLWRASTIEAAARLVFHPRGRDGAAEHVRDELVSENTLSLNKTVVLFGIAVLGMIMFAVIVTMPTAGRLMASQRALRSPCHTEQVPLDQGYGVSRFVERRVCDDE